MEMKGCGVVEVWSSRGGGVVGVEEKGCITRT